MRITTQSNALRWPLVLAVMLAGALTSNADEPRKPSMWPTGTGLFGAADSAMTAYKNPAAMSGLERSEIVGRLIVGGSESTDVVASSGLGLGREEDDSGGAGVPLLYYVRPMNERWTAGISLMVPAGFGNEYDSNSPARYLVEEWSLFYVAVSPALSYRINESWSVGFGTSLNYARFDHEAAVLNPPGFDDGDLELEADGFALSFFAGVSYAPRPSTRVGLIYRSETDMELEGDPDFAGLSPQTEMLLDQAGLLDAEIEIGATLPPVWGAGVTHRFGNGVAASVDVARVLFSEFVLTEFAFLEDSRVLRQPTYDDIWAFSTGWIVPLAPRWQLGLGAAHVESPVTTRERSVALRIDRISMLGVGFERSLENDRSLAFHLSYTDLGDAPVESSQLPVLGTLTAEYKDNAALLLDVRYRWGLGGGDGTR